ncbi:hypothetical protein AC1031_016626 [Aphanomyces cochlioides]|nr:hypothetical protein AC1031_016626 [Aphanomyces cochlioides]
MKKSRSSTSSPLSMLPLDIIVKITFYTTDGEDVLAFLKALSPSIELGPLEELLNSKEELSQLWPTLKLWKDISSYEAVAKYYSNVVIYRTEDADWFEKYLNPMASIEWFVEEFPQANQVYNKFWKLRITRVNICLTWQEERRFRCKNSLRRLAHLTSLCIGDNKYCDDNEDDYHRIWHDLFEFAAKSDQLAKFQLFPENHSLTADNATTNLIKWSRRRTAQVFEFKTGENNHLWDEIDHDVEQSFSQVMLTSPLKPLKLTDWDFQDVDLTGISFAMESLQFYKVDSASMETVISQLEGSRVKELEIQEYAGARVGLERLLRILPRTSITRLQLTEIDCSSIEWCALAPLFAECPLEFLSVDFFKSIPPGLILSDSGDSKSNDIM